MKVDRRGSLFYQPSVKYGVASATPFVMLRGSTAVRRAVMPRLCEQAARFAHAGKKHREFELVASGLKLTTDGSAHVKARFGTDSVALFYADYCVDDPAWVQERLAANRRAPCSVRTIWITSVAIGNGPRADVAKAVLRRVG